MISASLVGGTAAVDRLSTIGEAVTSGIARVIAKLGVDLQNSVQQNKLSGQVLRLRSGALQQSITVRFEHSDGEAKATVYSDLDYAAPQEYGFAGTVSVRASVRQMKEAFGHPIASRTVSVSSYSRRMDLPQRSFMRSALADMTDDIANDTTEALREALSR